MSDHISDSGKKVSSIDWLIEQVRYKASICGDETKEKRARKGAYVDCIMLLQEAKEMEKQQVINAFGVGCQVESTRLIGYQDLAEQYYEQTYGKD